MHDVWTQKIMEPVVIFIYDSFVRDKNVMLYISFLLKSVTTQQNN
jgi:hypothetical protein